MDREVTLYARTECHLCEEAEAMLTRLAPELGFTIAKRNIDADPALQQRFTDVVPVVAIRETVVAEAPVDLAALRKALRAALSERPIGTG